MISTACPECTYAYARLGRRDGGRQPGCRNAFKSEKVPLTAEQFISKVKAGIIEASSSEAQHMRWARPT